MLKLPCVGLLMLAGILSNAHLALAQSQGACPLPAGMAPLAPPSVTAQQVEDGSASLTQFALAARNRYMSAGQEVRTLEGAAYLQCRIREEGSPWRSGSTYLVFLTPDGRVFEHAKSMALSGRLLKPSIYGVILHTLGINPAGLTNPAAALAAFAAVAGNGGSFHVPGVPGASGYAAVYAANPQVPIMLAGFDLNESHLAEEEIDYGDPSVTARDVVDRQTLKAFVTEAIKYFVSLLEKSDPAALSKARTALRDENGPWKHGPVYLYALERTSNVTWFHGAFPDRFEYRPLGATPRDVVTGESILPQLIEAALSGPEGGFVEYYFDDPNDEADSADIPKVGYARQLFVQVPRVDGTVFTLDFIVGSGFYLSDPGVIAHRQNLAIKSIQPQVMRAMTGSMVDAISSRVEQAVSDTAAKGFSLGGASTLSDVLLANGEALENGTFDLGRLLTGSSFTLPLNAADAGISGVFRNLTIWGSGDYRDFSGGDRQIMHYEGDVVSLNFGMDARLGTDMLAGLSVARTKAEVDYDDVNGGKGESTTTLTSVNPYVGWQVDHSINIWATAGYGWGDIQVDDAAVAAQEGDLEQQMVAAGISGLLFEGGATTVRVKAETAYTWADIGGEGTLESLTLDANRSRLMLEGTHEQALDSGATLTASLEVGVRHDGGDGEDGESVETGGGVRYAHPASGVSIEARARALLGHDGDYDEWGISGLVRLDPGTDGVGLALSVEPQWGQTASGVQRLWETGAVGWASPDSQAPMRMSARVAYGYAVMWAGRQGVLTPYADVSLSGEGSRRLSLGGQFNAGSSVRMSLEIMRDQPAHGDANQGVMLSSNFDW